MTLYELNQANYAGLPDMTDEDLENSRGYIIDFLNKNQSKYYMFLNNEWHYYTIFTFKDRFDPGALTHEFIDLLKSLGGIKSIEVNGSGDMLECWVTVDDDCKMFGFFSYDGGVITV